MQDNKKKDVLKIASEIAETVRKVLEKNEITSEYFETMAKSNSSHIIEAGQEPSASKTESANMEDEPLQDEKEEGSHAFKEKKDDKKSKEKTKNGHIMVDKEDKGEQKDTDDGSYEFRKSESGMHTITYKRLAKKGRCWDGYEPVKGKKAYSDDSCKKISKEEKEMDKGEGMSVGQAVSMIMSDKHGINDVMDKVPKEMRDDVLAALRGKDAKKAEMCKGYMDKCGDMKVAKAEGDGKQRISTKRFENGEKKMTREGHNEVKRTSMNPSETGKQFQDSRKKMGQWRSSKYKETGNDEYLGGKRDHEYEKSEAKKCGDMKQGNYNKLKKFVSKK